MLFDCRGASYLECREMTMSRKVKFQMNGFYHIYNRGVNREPIFFCDENYRYLLRIIKDYTNSCSISVIAYCLMPNHYHFLLQQKAECSISTFMQAVFNRYPKAINKKYNRSGTLFEGPFKSIAVTKQEYLLHLCRYIHRNPVDGEKPLVSRLEDWKFSNYLEWIGERKGSLVDMDFIREGFHDQYLYRQFVLEYKPAKKLHDDLKKYYLD